MKAEVTGGEVSDYKGYDVLADDDLPTARVLIADKGYDADHIRENIIERGGTPVIPGRSNRKIPIPVDGFIYALRNQIERCFNKLKCARRFATRYDKTVISWAPRITSPNQRLSDSLTLSISVEMDDGWTGRFLGH